MRGCAWRGCSSAFSARNLRTELAGDLIVRIGVSTDCGSAVRRLLRRGRLAADGSRLGCLRRGYLHHLALLLFFKDTLSHVLLVICFCDQVGLDRILPDLDSDVVVRTDLVVLRRAKGR